MTFIYDGGILMEIPFLTSVRTAVSAYKAAVKTLDDAKIVTATEALDAKLIETGAHVLAQSQKALEAVERERSLLGRIHALEDKVRELEETASEKARYELVEDYPGTITYRVKESARGTEPAHYLCPGCLDNRAVKSILQFSNSKKRLAQCPECKRTYRLASEDPPPERPPAPGGPLGWMAR